MNANSRAPVYIILPVYNRKSVTLTCLKTLEQQGDLQHYYLVVVDDGSTDGTRTAIQAQYPTVEVLTGDGNLWWTGAIRKGMEYAVAQAAEYLIWLNDDCLPQPGAIATLLEQCQANPNLIAGGQSLDPETRKPSYGGILCRGAGITYVHAVPDMVSSSGLDCDGLAGNFVCLPRSVVERVGYPDPGQCPHYYGDVVYTHRAKRKGYQLRIVGDAIALCKDDHVPESWLTTQRSLAQVWGDRFQIKSPHYWKAHLRYYWEMLGILGLGKYGYELLIRFLAIAILVTLLPLEQRIQLKTWFRRSLSAWQSNRE